MVLSESNVDIDKVLLKLDAKDFTVEKSTLQSLQQLIQWVADLTLTILVRLPENRCHNRSGGVSTRDQRLCLGYLQFSPVFPPVRHQQRHCGPEQYQRVAGHDSHVGSVEVAVFASVLSVLGQL